MIPTLRVRHVDGWRCFSTLYRVVTNDPLTQRGAGGQRSGFSTLYRVVTNDPGILAGAVLAAIYVSVPSIGS